MKLIKTKFMRNIYFIKIIVFIYIIFSYFFCLPIPHFSRSSPDITGIIRNKPNTPMKIYINIDYREINCNNFDNFSEIKPNGEFNIPPVKNFQIFVMLIGDPIMQYELCLDTLKGRKRILYRFYTGYGPWKSNLECDFNNINLSTLKENDEIIDLCIVK